jgi:hypothetical protein
MAGVTVLGDDEIIKSKNSEQSKIVQTEDNIVYRPNPSVSSETLGSSSYEGQGIHDNDLFTQLNK